MNTARYSNRRNGDADSNRAQETAENTRSEQRFRALSQITPQVVCICNADGRFIGSQEQWEKFTGQCSAQCLGDGWLGGIHPADAEPTLQLWKRSLSAGQPFRAEFRLRRADGEYRLISQVATPIMGADGQIAEWLVVHTDLTAKKEAEEKTARALQELRDLKAALDEHAIVAITDPQGRITYVNDKFCAISKYSREELLGKDHRIINSGYHSKAFIRNLWETISAGRVWKGEIKNRAKDGSFYWVDTTIVPYLDGNGKPFQYIAIRADITDRKLADEQKEKALRELSDVKAALDEHAIVAITDWKGRITYVNDKFCAISKYSREELLGKDHRIINSGYHTKAFIRDLWETISSGQVWKGEIKNRAKDGSYYWVDTTIVPYLGEDGRPVQYIAIRADITERKNAEAALQKAQEELQQHATKLEQMVEARTAALRETIAELETFSYSISHDMRAPLRAMHSFSQILTEDLGDGISPEAKDYLRRISSASARMDSLIQDVLTYSQVARNDLPLQPVDLRVLLHDILDTYPGFQPPAAKVELKGDFPSVMAIPAVLTQCISNLVGNGVKFVPTGRMPEIQIWAEDAAGDRARLFFKDNGKGIVKESHEKIFGIFYREGKDFDGTGIGLSIVKKGVERMGGRVGLESEPGKGSTFWLELVKAPGV